MDARGADKREAAERSRRTHRHLEREPGTERVADDIDRLEPLLVEIAQIKIGHVVDQLEPRRHFGLAEAWMIWGDDGGTRSKVVDERLRRAHAIDAMQI